MSTKTASPPLVHIDEVPEASRTSGQHWGAYFRSLTPSMKAQGGSLGINLMRVPPGRTTCPFHSHVKEDEAFYILSGRGILRYGEELYELGPGHCVSCPAGTGVAHQIANPFDEELLYLAIGHHDPHEVCIYPDSDKVMIRPLQKVGRLEPTEYLHREPERPKIFELFGASKA